MKLWNLVEGLFKRSQIKKLQKLIGLQLEKKESNFGGREDLLPKCYNYFKV